jgi:putative hydrolase of the HAD superfamily
MSNSNNIKAVAFDLGNVLLPFSRWKAVFNISHVTGKNPFSIALFFVLFRHWQDFDLGKYTAQEFYEIEKKGLKFDTPAEKFFSAFADMFRENSNVINSLPLLKQKYKLILLSDINPIHAGFCFERYNFFKIFDETILSYQVKVKKPSKKMFDILTAKAGVKPEQIVFVDDKLHNVLGARKYGICGIHFRGEKQLMNQFHRLSLLPNSQS